MPDASPGAPAPTSPDGDTQVQIALGPDQSIYPESLRPPEASPAPPAEDAPEPDHEATIPEPPPESAGPVDLEKASPEAGETRGARRRAAEDAYQRGLAEGRAAIEREQQQRAHQDQAEQTQREANQRVEQLFNDLNSADYATQDRARQGILQMYHGNRQAQALQQTTRQQVLAEMATEFGTLRDMDGVDDAGYQSLHTAPSAAELAKRAYELGKKARDDQVARLEAELQGLRGRLVGSRATPERANGATHSEGNITIEEYATLSPKDARKLSPSQIDAITAQLAADAARSRS
jgi:hypothetical protein